MAEFATLHALADRHARTVDDEPVQWESLHAVAERLGYRFEVGPRKGELNLRGLRNWIRYENDKAKRHKQEPPVLMSKTGQSFRVRLGDVDRLMRRRVTR